MLERRKAAVRVICGALGVELSPEFELALMDWPREKIVYGGWRAGKSTEGACEIAIDYLIERLPNGKPALYWLVGPDYAQTSQEYNYLVQWFTKLNLVASSSAPLEGPRLLVLKDGTQVHTKSAQYPERLGSEAPDMIIVCEAGQVSDEVRLWLMGRTMEKRARIVYTGTLEDEEANRQWAWYIELGSKWMQDKDDEEHSAYSLPSWSNRVVFPGGRNDPEILNREREWREFTGGDFVFLRRIAGQPTGVQYQVYPHLDLVNLLRAGGTQPWHHAVGGIDAGTVHPSSHCVITVHDNDIAWVRESTLHFEKPMESYGVDNWIWDEKERLSRTYRCWNWATDPNERFLAKSFRSTGVSYSTMARDARIRLVWNRLDSGRLLFDLNGPGVPELYEEMRRVHRRKQRDGQVVLVREHDDRTAALEDAIEILDGVKKREVPTLFATRTYPEKRFRRKEFVSRV